MADVMYSSVIKATLGSLPDNAPNSLASLEHTANQWFGHFGRRITQGHMLQYPGKGDFECMVLATHPNGEGKKLVGVGSIFAKGVMLNGIFLPYSYIDKLAADPEFSGNGVGKGIIRYAVDMKREEGLPSIHALRTSVDELDEYYHEVGQQLQAESGIRHIAVYLATSGYGMHFFGYEMHEEECLKELAEIIAAEKSTVFPANAQTLTSIPELPQ